MCALKPADRFDLLRNIHRQFEAILESFPVELQPAIIHSYGSEDFDSPGLLSLAMLPYWVGERLNLARRICQDMAVGNLFLLHCFQSFDFIVDDDRPGTSVRSQVVLGNLCHQQVLRHYRPYFPPGSPFWERMEVYWREWSESILWEVEEQNTRRPFEETHLTRSAHKAAALKICPTGLALLAGQAGLIPQFEQAVDLMHAVMQLIDDLIDWQEDLLHRRYNTLLGLMVSEGLLNPQKEHAAEDIYTLIFDSNILDGYLQIIRQFADRGVVVTEDLEIEPWAMLVDGLVKQARWKVERYKQVYKQVLGTYLPA